MIVYIYGFFLQSYFQFFSCTRFFIFIVLPHFPSTAATIQPIRYFSSTRVSYGSKREISEDSYDNPDIAPSLHPSGSRPPQRGGNSSNPGVPSRPRAMDVASSIVTAVKDDKNFAENKVCMITI